MVKKIKKGKLVTGEQLLANNEANTGTITPVIASKIGTVTPAPKKKQVELSNGDLKLLGEMRYSTEAWGLVARRHNFDYLTMEQDPHDRRVLYAVHKVYQSVPIKPGILTSDGNKTLLTKEELEAKRATQAGVQELITPISDEVTFE